MSGPASHLMTLRHQPPMRFTIVTPSFNQAPFLERTIRSVLSQDGLGSDFDLQYRIIDGGSTDGSVEIIRRFERQLDRWCSEPDGGQTHAINKGFEDSSGQLRAYLNSDDVLRPGALRTVAAAHRNNPAADLLHGVCLKIDADDRILGEQVSTIDSLCKMIDLWDYWLRPKHNQNFIQPEVFWTERLATRIGKFNESLHYTMDFDYWLRAFDAGMQPLRIEKPLASFRIHESQKTTDRHSSVLELIDGIEPYLSRTDDERLPADDRRRIAALAQMTRQTIGLDRSAKARQLLSLAVDNPTLLKSSHYWKQVRRTGKSMLRRAA